MKKFTFLFAALVAVVFSANAQLNNPKDADGYFIVKWDCATNAFASANDWEADETFTLAIDVAGTPLATWLAGTPANQGATRSIAFNVWTGFGDTHSDARRLKQISGTVYGATFNFVQVGAASFDVAAATIADAQLSIMGQVFGFEYTADNPGAAWWQEAIAGSDGGSIVSADGVIAKSAPYTGTKTSEEEFINSDYPGLFDVAYGTVPGYTVPCAMTIDAINEIPADANIVDTQIFNLQGMRLNAEPVGVPFIRVDVLDNGKKIANTIIKK
ncbi:MAG: hypothetical protein LBS50_04245 [Prevotellaceae bacterium]|jgi:hypothetical protein|nr:hypothetical protein [Prevotellaceae bacterium]